MKLSEIVMLPAATTLHVTCAAGLVMSLPVVIAQAKLLDLFDGAVAGLAYRIFPPTAETGTETPEVAA